MNQKISAEDFQIDVSDSNMYKPELLQDLPDAAISNQIITKKKLDQINAQKISDLIQLDSSLSESYSSVGYSDSVSVRGITLNSQNNYLRDGLPFLVDAPVQFENKSRVEIIKGTYGILSGLSSPGGIINYVTEKPTTNANMSSNTKIKTELTSAGQFGAQLGTNSFWGADQKYLYRFDLAATKLSTNLKNSAGKKYLASFSFKSKPVENLTVDTNIESSYQSQASQPGFSMLGSKIPTDINPDINLNNQSWTQPVEFTNLIGAVKINYEFNKNTKISVSALGQNILTNDRVAFPFGCTAESVFDRYCSDGTFDVYDFRSENEKRKNNVVQFYLNHQFEFLKTQNKISLSYQNRNVTEIFDKQAYNYSGIGSIDGNSQTPENSILSDENTNKKFSADELTFFHQLQYQKISTTMGLKYASISKKSIRTNETRATDIKQNFMLPWATLSYTNENNLIYTSYSEGIESYVTPNKLGYSYPGQNIPDAVSRQIELGFKNTNKNIYGFSLFYMTRPQIEDSAPIYTIDGQQKNIGAEINSEVIFDNYKFDISGLFLQAKTENAEINKIKNNKTTINTPQTKIKIGLDYNFESIQGLSLNSIYHFSSERFMTADNNLTLPSWMTLNVGCQYLWNKTNTISLRIDNLTDNKYWKESPTQFGHIYLFPGVSRQLTAIYSSNLN